MPCKLSPGGLALAVVLSFSISVARQLDSIINPAGIVPGFDTAGTGGQVVLTKESTLTDLQTGHPDNDSSVKQNPDTSGLPRLNTITVEGRRSPGPDAVLKPSIINGNEIRESSRSTPLETVSQSSGDIYVSSRGTGLHGVSSGASGGIYIRGLGGSPNSQILVVEDGAPDYQGIFGHPIPDAFFPSLMDRVIVIKGGDAVLYGTNALGGVIVVENRWAEKKGLHIENDAAFGSYNTIRERAALLYKGERTDLVSAVSLLNTDGHRDGMDGNSAACQVGIRWRLPRSASIIVRNKLFRLQGGDPGVDFRPWTDHRFDVIRNNFSARISIPVKNVALKIIPWVNLGEHRLHDGFLSRDLTGGGIIECAGSLINEKMQYLIGTSGEYVDGRIFERDTLIRELPVRSSKGADVYAQVSVKHNSGLTGVTGGRFHYNNIYGSIPLYKAGLSWEIMDFITFRTRLTRNFRQPTFRELYLPFPVANDTLRPETALNWDGGLDINIGKIQFGGSVFRTKATNMIKYFGMPPGAVVENIDMLKIWGVEGKIELKRAGPFDFLLTGSWQDVGRFTKQNPSAKINGKAGYTSVMKKGVLEMAIEGEWVHDLYMNNYAWEEDRIDDVFFLDGSIRFRTHIRETIPLEPYCMIRNFLNLRYEYIQYYRMPGINIFAGFVIKV